MRNGTCPKCDSGTVYAKPDGLKYAIQQGTLFIHTGFMTAPSPAASYICITCGYFENYIADQNKLYEVSTTWQQVPPQTQ